MNTPLRLMASHAVFLFTAILGTAGDLISKNLIFLHFMPEDDLFPRRIEVIPPFFGIHCNWNSGALFGIGQGLGPVFILISIVAVIVVPLMYLHLSNSGLWLAFGLGAIEAGALGNLYDRMRYGRVRDFIDLHWGRYYWPTFNIADALICAGLFALFIGSFYGRQEPSPEKDSIH